MTQKGVALESESIIVPMDKEYNNTGFNYSLSEVNDLSVIETAFGATSFPERAFQENLEIIAKYEQDTGVVLGMKGYCLRCCSLLNDQPAEQVSVDPTKDGPETAAMSHEVMKDGGKLEDLKTDHEEVNLQPGNIRLWNLIYQNLSSNSAVECSEEPARGFDGENTRTLPTEQVSASSKELSDLDNVVISGSEAQAIEYKKKMAIKLVREAIDNILLPEVEDMSSDDHSMPTNYVCIKQHEKEIDFLRKNEASGADKAEIMASGQVAQNAFPRDSADIGIKGVNRVFSRKTDKAALNQWSNLKKWILLHKFIKELEKVRRFDVRSLQTQSLNESKAEKITLRRKTLDGRKSGEEWMLDYALRQAVGQLDPDKKKKVALLVKAFETVVPAQEDSHVGIRIMPVPGVNENELHSYVSGASEENTGSKLTKEPSVSNDISREFQSLSNVKDSIHLSDDSPPNFTELKMDTEMERNNHIKMWHLIYQHVVSSVAEKVGSGLLDGLEENENTFSVTNDELEISQKLDGKDMESSNVRIGLTKSDIIRLIKETVDEILAARDESFKAQPSLGDDDNIGIGQVAISKRESETSVEVSKARKWSKLKNVVLVKGSIKALEEIRKKNKESEKAKLKSQVVEERNKAEQWMVDYAVQHIVTKLTPSRKRRVSMLVEAFEAVIPFPEM